jgi:hypothetical protein
MIDCRPFIRPSSLPALALCPGRALMEARACAQAPWLEAMQSDAAREGTLAHEAIAQVLLCCWQEKMPADLALDRCGALLARLSPWAKQAARTCVAYALALRERLERESGGPVTSQVERHLGGDGIGIRRGGTADLVLIGGNRVVVVDWKCGFLDQGNATTHRQLHAYAVMAWDRYRQPLGIRSVDIHLAQGRLRAFSAARFTEAWIEAARADCQRVVAAASADAPPLAPSIGACRYCKALPWCRAARESIMDAIAEHALFGEAPDDVARQDEAAALARRFAAAVKDCQLARRNAQATTRAVPCGGVSHGA